MFGWFPTQQAQESLKLSNKSQPAGTKTGHFTIFFKTSSWSTVSITHLGLGIKQLHFVSRSAHVQCSIDFIIATTVTSHFRRIQFLGSLYNAICAHTQSCIYHIQSRHAHAHGHVVSTHSIMSINDHASAYGFSQWIQMIFRYLAVYFKSMCYTVIAKGFMSLLAITGVA